MKSFASFLLALTLLVAPRLLLGQEYYFKLTEESKERINTIVTKAISIDKVEGSTVYAYANPKELEKIKSLGYQLEMLAHPSSLAKSITMATTIAQMASWDRYPTYEVYRGMMKKWQQDYPTLCKLDSIGATVDGRKLYVVKISDNVLVDEAEPEFFYTSTMHGNETTGFYMMLRLIDYLLANYETDTRVANMVNNMAIYINPDANPDGTYNGGNSTVSGATRGNGNGIDFNRNFPDPKGGDHPDGYSWQPETVAFMNYAGSRHFVLSANFHGGIELANYPWDTWLSAVNPHADNDWWYTVARQYADLAQANSPSGYFTGQDDGVTHGADWYVVEGGRQDYMNYWHHCREMTLEVSDVMLVATENLIAHWNYNREAILTYMELVFKGFYGTVTNSSGQPLNATITIVGHDKDNSQVVTNSTHGNYYRMIEPGTYNVTFSASGYSNVVVNGVVIGAGESKILNVVMGGSASNVPVSGVVLNSYNNNPVVGASVTIATQSGTLQTTTNEEGVYTFASIPNGMVKLSVSAEGFFNSYYHENVTSTSTDFTLKIIEKQSLTGSVNNAETSLVLEGVTVSLVGGSNSTTTNSEGLFTLADLSIGLNSIRFSKSGFISQTIEYTLPYEGSVSVSLMPSDAESFESNIPAGFTFTGGNWTRDNTVSYDGNYSMKSAVIGNSAQTSMEITLNVASAGSISFLRKVSSESGYDFLRFYIDGVEKGEWSGAQDWTEVSYPVTTGSHLFKWEYSKDGSQVSGSDCAWVDNIIFPQSYQNVVFTVKSSSVAVSGATVSFNSTQQTTNASGVATFSNVQRGSGKAYSVTKTGYEAYEGSLSVLYTNVAQAVSITLAPVETYTVSFVVTGVESAPIEGAAVVFNSVSKNTNAIGEVQFDGIEAGTYDYAISAEGYTETSGSVEVSSEKTVPVNLIPLSAPLVIDGLLSLNAWPIPFSSELNIELNLSTPAEVSLDVYSITGQKVATIAHENNHSGLVTIKWSVAENIPNGVYFIKVTVNGNLAVKKVLYNGAL